MRVNYGQSHNLELSFNAFLWGRAKGWQNSPSPQRKSRLKRKIRSLWTIKKNKASELGSYGLSSDPLILLFPHRAGWRRAVLCWGTETLLCRTHRKRERMDGRGGVGWGRPFPSDVNLYRNPEFNNLTSPRLGKDPLPNFIWEFYYIKQYSVWPDMPFFSWRKLISWFFQLI